MSSIHRGDFSSPTPPLLRRLWKSLLHTVVPGISTFLFNTCRVKIGPNCGRLDVTHYAISSNPTNRLCYSRSTYASETENIPPQQSSTRPPGRVNLRMMSFIRVNPYLITERTRTSCEVSFILRKTWGVWHMIWLSWMCWVYATAQLVSHMCKHRIERQSLRPEVNRLHRHV